jgi:hypothetical protein
MVPAGMAPDFSRAGIFMWFARGQAFVLEWLP